VVHEVDAKRTLGFVLIVRAASEPNVPNGGPPASRDGLDVIELKPMPLFASMP